MTEMDQVWNEAFAEGYAEGYRDGSHLESYPGENDPPEACTCPLGRDHTLREWIKWLTERPKEEGA